MVDCITNVILRGLFIIVNGRFAVSLNCTMIAFYLCAVFGLSKQWVQCIASFIRHLSNGLHRSLFGLLHCSMWDNWHSNWLLHSPPSPPPTHTFPSDRIRIPSLPKLY